MSIEDKRSVCMVRQKLMLTCKNCIYFDKCKDKYTIQEAKEKENNAHGN